ncbi:hypothetical protein B7494_g2652 [Chlorociboria aeruginascens]|nr:hypothetical protein B7494_g2652 [Chlorociboria aeruginascens]
MRHWLCEGSSALVCRGRAVRGGRCLLETLHPPPPDIHIHDTNVVAGDGTTAQGECHPLALSSPAGALRPTPGNVRPTVTPPSKEVPPCAPSARSYVNSAEATHGPQHRLIKSCPSDSCLPSPLVNINTNVDIDIDIDIDIGT